MEIEENVRKSGNILEYSLAIFLGMGMDSLFNKRQQSNNIHTGTWDVARGAMATGGGFWCRVKNIVDGKEYCIG